MSTKRKLKLDEEPGHKKLALVDLDTVVPVSSDNIELVESQSDDADYSCDTDVSEAYDTDDNSTSHSDNDSDDANIV